MNNYDVLNSKWDVDLSTSLEQLNHSLDEMRALEVSHENFLERLTGVFGNAFNAMRLCVNKMTTSEQVQLKLNETNISKMTRSAMSKNYTYLMDRQISVPVGLNGPMVAYTSASLTAAQLLEGTLALVVQLRADVGRVLSTEGGLKDSTLFNVKPYQDKSNAMKQAWKFVGRHRTGDDYTAERPYGEVFRNNSELFDAFDQARKGNSIYNTIDRRKLIAEVETTMNYIRELNTVARTQGFSKPLIDRIGIAVGCVAEFVEAFSAGVFNQEMITKSLNNISEEISQLI